MYYLRVLLSVTEDRMLFDRRFSSLPDAELVTLLVQKQNTLPELASRYDAYLSRYVSRRIADRSQIEDVIQDIWLEVFKSCATFDKSRPFRNWLSGISRNIVAGHYKKQRRIQSMEINESRMFQAHDDNCRESSFDPPAKPNSPSHRAEERELLQRIRANLHRIPRVARKTVEYIMLNGLSCSDVAKQLGKSQGTIRNRYNAARTTLSLHGIELPPLPPKKSKLPATRKSTPALSMNKKVMAHATAPTLRIAADADQTAFGVLQKLDSLLPRLMKLNDFIGQLDNILTGVAARST